MNEFSIEQVANLLGSLPPSDISVNKTPKENKKRKLQKNSILFFTS